MEKWIADHQEQLAADIQELVRVPSVSGRPEECRQALQTYCQIARRYGFEVKDLGGGCAALWLPALSSFHEDTIERGIGLWAHLDVVPPGTLAEWKLTSPFDPVLLRNEGGRIEWIVGRGADDNKGAAIALLYVLRCLCDHGVRFSVPLSVFAGTDEEADMDDMAYFTRRYKSPALSLVADSRFPVCYGEKGILECTLHFSLSPGEDHCIRELKAGEASNMLPDTAYGVYAAHPSSQENNPETARLETVGTARHSAYPEGAVSAIALLIQRLLEPSVPLSAEEKRALSFFGRAVRDFSGESLNIACSDLDSGWLTCVGTMLRLTSDHELTLHLNIRYPVSVKGETLVHTLQTEAEKAGGYLTVQADSPPNYFPPSHPAVEQLTALCRSFYKQRSEAKGVSDSDSASIGENALFDVMRPYVSRGGTYARKLPRAFAFGPAWPDAPELPGVPFGHGGAHQPDEALHFPGLLDGIQLYVRALPLLDALLQNRSKPSGT